ncbi:MAG: amidohydrolase family protein [Firmicutes bacterium]|nr:amidohydrolase family protein [Bacillota bacterium]
MIVDVCVTPPVPEALREITHLPPHLANYAEVYRSMAPFLEALSRLTPEDVLAMMDQAGVDVAVIHAEDVETTYGRKIPNEPVAALARAYPGRFVDFAGVDPNKGNEAVAELDHCLRHLGMRGAVLGPWEHRTYSDDEKYFPIYEKCVEFDVPVWIHTSLNYSRSIPMDYGHPLRLDRVAVEFPDLKIIAGHAGWPWVLEMIAVAWRHPTVHMDISAIRPRYLGTPDTGWGPLLRYGQTILKERLLFATAWPMQPFDRAVREMRELPLRDEVLSLWLGGNASKLLGLKEA